jgi:hypothetical protein
VDSYGGDAYGLSNMAFYASSIVLFSAAEGDKLVAELRYTLRISSHIQYSYHVRSRQIQLPPVHSVFSPSPSTTRARIQH